MEHEWDCIVVGAGAAGLSAALVLGRARRKTLVVDAGRQSNLAAHGIGGLLGQDGRPAPEFYAEGRDEIAKYPSVEFRSGEVAGGGGAQDSFVLYLAEGSSVQARRVLLAPGMDYRYPDLPGVAERWGRSVFHCPFCHGWEVREQALGVLDRGESGVRRALLLGAWSDDVTLFTDGPAELGEEDAERLRKADVAVDERQVAELRGPGETLTSVAFSDGGERECGAMLVPVTLHQRSTLAGQLGAVALEPNPMAADRLQVDAAFATTVPGVFAAGDISVQMPSVASAVAAGSLAAAQVVHGLTSM